MKKNDLALNFSFFFALLFLQEDMEMAKYISRLFTARHKFYKQNKICAECVGGPHTTF